jgi:hypothetical protein
LKRVAVKNSLLVNKVEGIAVFDKTSALYTFVAVYTFLQGLYFNIYLHSLLIYAQVIAID